MDHDGSLMEATVVRVELGGYLGFVLKIFGFLDHPFRSPRVSVSGNGSGCRPGLPGNAVNFSPDVGATLGISPRGKG